MVSSATDTDNLPDVYSQVADGIPCDYGTQKQRCLIAVLLSPDLARRQVKEKCKIAGISRREYYRLMADEKFLANYHKLARSVKGRFTPDIFGAFVENATRGGRDGLGDTKAQIAFLTDPDIGILRSPTQTSVNFNVSTDELQKLSQERINTGIRAFADAVDAEYEVLEQNDNYGVGE